MSGSHLLSLPKIATALILVTAGAPAALPSAGHAYLEKHCFDCHDGTTQKGGLNLADLPADLSKPHVMQAWTDVFDRIARGEMPPKKKPRPEPAATAALLATLKQSLTAADAARRGVEGRVVLRRLNRAQYEHTMRDLLGIELELSELLPEDTSSMGFDDIGEALHTSSVLMERYLEAADVALDAALATGPKPASKAIKVAMIPVKVGPKDYRLRAGAFAKPDDSLIYVSSDVPIICDRFRAPVAGRYRVRISASAFQSPAGPQTFGVYVGAFDGRSPKTWLTGHYDVTGETPTVIEFEYHLPVKGTIKIAPHGLGRREILDQAQPYDGPGLTVHSVEFEGPLDAWPPVAQAKMFGNLDLAKGTLAEARKALTWFAPRAFRRPVADAEVEPYVALVKAQLDAGIPFPKAIRAGLKGILCSLDFLFLKERTGPLTDLQVAARLSYFLWSSAPDDELLRAAALGTLTRPAVMRAQVERMLADPKAHRFTEDFTGQWLLLRLLDFTTPDKKLFPEHDELLQSSMIGETQCFFEELIAKDLSVLNVVDSDFAMLNGRLAEHYGIPGVSGQEIHRVALPPGTHRGGVMTQASVLKVTANGTNTSPVVRGAWVLRNIIGRPPKPPPPNVPAIEPDIRGAKTIREQLDKHRALESCSSCHNQMDPPGMALESFDVIGGWRENYRALGSGKRVKASVAGKPVGYSLGPPVDASDALTDGRKFANIDEFKKLLLADPDQVVRTLAEKLLVYSTGGVLGFADREVVDGIVARLRTKHNGLRALIHEITLSRTFLTK